MTTIKRTGNPKLHPIESNVQNALDKQAAGNVLNGAALLADLNLVAGKDNIVPHMLGRVPQGYHVSRRNADASIYDSPTKNPLPDKNLILRTSANVKASILVF